MIKHLNKETLSTMLRESLPGEAAQNKFSPELREGPSYAEALEDEGEQEDECRSAAVLILLYPDKDHLRTVFMKRNEYDGPHSGQISFPGGMFEKVDLDLEQTALRETEEEIGVDAGKIDVLGRLTPLFIPVSNFCVTPYVGWITGQPDFSLLISCLTRTSFGELLQ